MRPHPFKHCGKSKLIISWLTKLSTAESLLFNICHANKDTFEKIILFQTISFRTKGWTYMCGITIGKLIIRTLEKKIPLHCKFHGAGVEQSYGA